MQRCRASTSMLFRRCGGCGTSARLTSWRCRARLPLRISRSVMWAWRYENTPHGKNTPKQIREPLETALTPPDFDPQVLDELILEIGDAVPALREVRAALIPCIFPEPLECLMGPDARGGGSVTETGHRAPVAEGGSILAPAPAAATADATTAIYDTTAALLHASSSSLVCDADTPLITAGPCRVTDELIPGARAWAEESMTLTGAGVDGGEEVRAAPQSSSQLQTLQASVSLAHGDVAPPPCERERGSLAPRRAMNGDRYHHHRSWFEACIYNQDIAVKATNLLRAAKAERNELRIQLAPFTARRYVEVAVQSEEDRCVLLTRPRPRPRPRP